MNKVILAALMLAALPAQAKILDTTRSLGSGHVGGAAGVDFGLSTPNTIRLELHERVGLAGGVDLYFEQYMGLRRESGLQVGAGLKWTLLSRKRDRAGFALRGGGLYHTGTEVAGLSATFLGDWSMGRLTPYAGLDLDAWFQNGVDSNFTLLGGARIAVVKHVGAFVEGGLALTGARQRNFLAVGLRLDL